MIVLHPDSNPDKIYERLEQADVSISRLYEVLSLGVGAAGFEPATAWSEAKYSVQTELSARGRTLVDAAV